MFESILDIKDDRIYNQTCRVLERLGHQEIMKTRSKKYPDLVNVGHLALLIEHNIEGIYLRTIKERVAEIEKNVIDFKESIEKLKTDNQRDATWNLEDLVASLQRELSHLDLIKKRKQKVLGYVEQECEYGGQDGGPLWRIILVKENLEKVSAKEIRLCVGHELAHVYLDFTVNYGHQFGYEVDDRLLCNFIATRLFGVK